MEDFSWLAGKGKVQTDSAEMYEEWWFENSELTGHRFSINDGEKVISEYLILKSIGDKTVYIAFPVKQTPTLFNLVKTDNSTFTFQNLEHDFPQTIIYNKISDKKLHVSVEGMRNGKNKVPD